MMQYRSIAELSSLIRANLNQIPADIDLVVGIPRSGMLAATMISLHLNLPLTDVEGLLEGRAFRPGRRRNFENGGSVVTRARRALIVDDSASSGRQMLATKAQVAAANLQIDTLYAAVYATSDCVSELDLHFEIVPMPRMFEWNVMHHPLLAEACVDIDGILCEDPANYQNDDGKRYCRFLSEARPLFKPTVEVGWLVTNRLEKYRPQTEKWLAINEIKYRNLLMWDLPDGKTRSRLGGHGQNKAKIYRKLQDAHIFIESCPSQAAVIAEESGKPCLCLVNNELYQPNTVRFVQTKLLAKRSSLNAYLLRLLTNIDYRWRLRRQRVSKM